MDEHEAFVPHHLVSWCLVDTDNEPVLDVGYDAGRGQ